MMLALFRTLYRRPSVRALLTTVLDNQRTIMAKLDQIISDINDETNALAAKIDGLEIAAGGTVTQANLDALAAISTRLKGLAADPAAPAVPVVVVPTPSVAPSADPAPSKSSAS